MTKKRILIMIILGLAYTGYEAWDFYSSEIPQMEAARQAAENELTGKQRDLVRLRSFAQNIENIKRELGSMNVQLESALEHMPRNFNLSSLLRKLTMLAQNSGVELSSFRPRKAEDRTDGAFYNTVSIDFDLRGSFTQSLVFLDQVSRLKRIIDLDEMKVSAPTENTTTRGGSVVTDVRGVIRTYRFVE